MITVQNLVKMYGQVAALQGITFEVPSGQVVGFVGPNGAGKSTTMKILTGFLYATNGKAALEGIDVRENPLEVRRRVGYLPETNPLYTDMRVDDYLSFVAEVRGVKGARRRAAMDRVVQVCGLGTVFKKGISELSKGFRQRVGLAQAMIHDPQILILDEPTSGLDPNQIVEIRDLIRSLGTNRTVVLSTHYLQEVEAACDRIIIVAQGNIVADGTGEELCARLPAGALALEIIGPPDTVHGKLKDAFTGARVDMAPQVEGSRSTRFHVVFASEPDTDAREIAHDLVQANGWKILELKRKSASLEDVFRRLTANGAAAVSAEPAMAPSQEGAIDV
ncbi:MAG: ABC transporter [Planctomycetes bacterium]|nr:ABC transporter [Planctomycetota bacterium]